MSLEFDATAAAGMREGSCPGLRFAYEWEQGEGVASGELAATWARLEVWVGADCVTQVEDGESGSARRSIYCPLYSLAEWIAFNWWLLTANIRPAALSKPLLGGPNGRRAPSLSSAVNHNLRAAADGFVWPNFAILPQGTSTRLVWQPDRSGRAGAPIRYIVGGDTIVDSAMTQRTLASLVEAVVSRLEERGFMRSALQLEWEAIAAADLAERDYCVAAALLGFDPYDVPPAISAAIEESAMRVDRRLLKDFLGAVDPLNIRSGAEWVSATSDALERITAEPSNRLAALHALRDEWAATGGTPWDRGYRHARAVRNQLESHADQAFYLEDMVKPSRLLSRDLGLQGLGGFSSSGAGGLVVGRGRKKRDVRFSSARALAHLAFDVQPERFLLTAAHGDKQRFERAFAAELLAPARGVQDMLEEQGAFVEDAQLERVANHFDVAPLVVRHQVENQLGLEVAL